MINYASTSRFPLICPRKLAFNLYSCICLGRDLQLVGLEPLQAGKPQTDVLNSKHCSNEFYEEQVEKMAANTALHQFLTVSWNKSHLGRSSSD